VEPRVKPLLRGVFHEAGFFVVLALSLPLVLSAETGKAQASAIVFSACLAACFGASALYHRPTWSPGVRSWLGRLDHAGIYLLIAGTYTPFGLLVLSRNWAIPVLAVVYTGAALAILTKLFWYRAPKPFSAGIALLLGWVAVAAVTQLVKVGAPGFALVIIGGAFYTTGAVIYALRRPDPSPAIFGYHELFHLCTIAAAACQYVAIAFFVLPRA
jgi:hemolysin III